MILTMAPCSLMIVPSLADVCKNATRMSTTVISLFSCASTNPVMNTDSVAAVGDLVSDFDLYSHCGLPSAHTLPLISPFLFCLRNIRYLRALSRISCVISNGVRGLTTFLSWNCLISFRMVFTPFSPNMFTPFFIPTCVSMRC